MKKPTSNPRTEASVTKATTVLVYATEQRLSLSQAARENNLGRNYVSDVNSRLTDNLENKNVSRDTYRNFKTAWKTYNKMINQAV
jgi:(p)ppGpp synthase/HD superfamily hydrolase